MRLSNKAKHQLAVRLISDHLIDNHYEHLVFSSDKSIDIYVPDGDTKIKVFCNYSGSDNLKISSDFETEESVLYLVVKPTRKNIHGFSCVGGDKSIVDKSIKAFDGVDSPKNIRTELLRIVSITKFIAVRRNLLEQKQAELVVTECKYPIIKSACVKSCRIPLVSSYIPKPFSKNFIAQH
jgi:hypothetical protein